MDSLLVQAILLGLLTAFIVIDWMTGTNNLSRPIVSSVFVGLIMGDLKMGIMMGATLELAFIGAITIGAARPPDTVSGGILGTAFAIATGKGAEFALTLAFPIAALFLLVDNLLTLLVLPMIARKADRYAEKGELKNVSKMHVLGFILVKSLPRALFVGFSFYLGSPVMERILNAIPTFVQDGINIAAGIMPALGFAILLQMLLKKDVFVYFVIGFALFSYLHVPILGIAIFGACLAYIIVNMETKAAMGSRGEEMVEDDF
ncbi:MULTISPECIES: PTS mannose/fructose/sorbose/N-acetylgalactosamine transporter subunit IIC [Enterococcus]|uniref:PTS sugar transporter subunit IIC n=1 Tax=Enterococcus faecium TaxID=1352 RepID=A0AB73TMG6_ENTFC|nr:MULTISPECIES: PTS sugar transporter subunit IIC [Enterococcus]EKZ0499255.1 PTS sugar transporter subunit IIC [Enterococcus faecium]KWY63309.1 PTS sugar transporter [Enterococcus faecium]MBG7805028.1 PTS sugar transporter subunit IIC [Enterococcus faecium]MBG7954856.1 PTS sugar transporter subunit IIC [Enterococcus faecium]MBG8284708.1 PTS sugar transporter subunit IIC [Enterococcus faecium]